MNPMKRRIHLAVLALDALPGVNVPTSFCGKRGPTTLDPHAVTCRSCFVRYTLATLNALR